MIECGILNRLRGTGVIKYFGTLRIEETKIGKLTLPKIEVEVKLVWNHVYGLYLALVFGLLAMNVWAGLAVLIAYLVGESKGWGEWVGALTRWETKDEEWLQIQYKDNEGVGFLNLLGRWYGSGGSFCIVAQLVERRTVNPLVARSSRALAAIY